MVSNLGMLSLVSARVLKHELRTPINHIIGYSELLLEELTDRSTPDQRRAVEALQTFGKRLLTLINTELGRGVGPDDVISTTALHALRTGVQSHVDSVAWACVLLNTFSEPEAASDVLKIQCALRRLVEFARTGNICDVES